MTQLPPKAPSMTQNWPSFPHLMMMPMSMGKDVINSSQHPSWVDEFLDFSSIKRTSHRRSSSDSVAFLPLLKDSSSPPRGDNSGDFEKFDDEQLMSMFVDDLPTTPTDNKNNFEDDNKMVALPRVSQPKEEPQEVDSLCNSGDAPPAKTTSGRLSVIPKGLRGDQLKALLPKILANRQSAQRSRVRKLQYISELERSVTTLQTEVSTLSPRVAYLDHQRLILNVDNSTLKQRIAAFMQDKIFKDAHQEALKKEIERLRQVYREQNLNKMGTTASTPPPTSDDNGNFTDNNNQHLDR